MGRNSLLDSGLPGHCWGVLINVGYKRIVFRNTCMATIGWNFDMSISEGSLTRGFEVYVGIHRVYGLGRFQIQSKVILHFGFKGLF